VSDSFIKAVLAVLAGLLAYQLLGPLFGKVTRAVS
jgi:hypothetical protein